MAETDLNPNSPAPAAPTKSQLVADVANLRALLDLVSTERDRLLAALGARDERLAKRREGGPGKLLGHIPVHDLDQPGDVVERATELFKGNLSVERASRFKTAARIRALDNWPLRKRLGVEDVPIGTEFDAHEIPDDDRIAWFANSDIIAIG